MSKKTFECVPDLSGNSVKHKPAPVRLVRFGNGYEQRQATGLLPKLRVWDLQKTADKTVIDGIIRFFDAVGCVESFYWQEPDGGRVLVKLADDYSSKQIGGRLYQINWRLEEVMV